MFSFLIYEMKSGLNELWGSYWFWSWMLNWPIPTHVTECFLQRHDWQVRIAWGWAGSTEGRFFYLTLLKVVNFWPHRTFECHEIIECHHSTLKALLMRKPRPERKSSPKSHCKFLDSWSTFCCCLPLPSVSAKMVNNCLSKHLIWFKGMDASSENVDETWNRRDKCEPNPG